MLRKVMFYTKKGIKAIILTSIATFLIIGAITLLYKPTYGVYLENNLIGYTENKSRLQDKINQYAEHGDGTQKNLAFVQFKSRPKYKLCLLKKGIHKDDEEIFEKVKEGEIFYYRYYAICENEEEKLYMSDFSEAEQVIKELKGKNSKNKEKLEISERYDTEIKDFTEKTEAVSKLYQEPERVVKVASSRSKNRGDMGYAKGTSNGKVNLGISLVRPTNGMITSRFGQRHGRFHKGLDIANGYGTNIVAASSGTVVYSGWDKYGLGKCIKIAHANGVETVYGHCSNLYVSVGQKVSQGQSIAAMGSTGNSTGSHLHFEIRVNSVAYNPQNYLY